MLPLVQTLGVHPRGITCLLDDDLLGVQALRGGPVEAVAACFFFGWILPVKSQATNHENSRGSPSIAAAILLRWWRMRRRMKAQDLCH